MGKLADFMAMKRDLAFDFEHELRAVRNLILGVTRISGTEYTIDLSATEGFVAGGRARAAFVAAFRTSVHDALVAYAHELARESLEHGIDQDIIGGALAGTPHAAPTARSVKPTVDDLGAQSGPVRLAACA